jgi:hypothetical protein
VIEPIRKPRNIFRIDGYTVHPTFDDFPRGTF